MFYCFQRLHLFSWSTRQTFTLCLYLRDAEWTWRYMSSPSRAEALTNKLACANNWVLILFLSLLQDSATERALLHTSELLLSWATHESPLPTKPCISHGGSAIAHTHTTCTSGDLRGSSSGHWSWLTLLGFFFSNHTENLNKRRSLQYQLSVPVRSCNCHLARPWNPPTHYVMVIHLNLWIICRDNETYQITFQLHSKGNELARRL